MPTPKHSNRDHALLSASGASRWLNCTPSARLEEKYGEKRSSSYAQEGTVAHELAELYIRHDILNNISEQEFDLALESLMSNPLFSEEMLSMVPIYVDYCMAQYQEALLRSPDAVAEAEVKLDLSDYVPDSFGTVDFVCIADGVIEIVDLKYGKGIQVNAEWNTQLMLYALGAITKYEMLYDLDTVWLTIVQPRIDNISRWSITVDELRTWAESVLKPAAEAANDGTGELSPGAWCQFCSVKHRCRKLYEEQLQIARMDFGTPELLSDEEVAEVVKKSKSFIEWINSVCEYAQKEAIENSKEWPGLKLVEGRSQRKWVDEDTVVNAIFAKFPELDENDIFSTKLKTITDIEKLVGKKAFAEKLYDVVVKPEGKPTLVPADDKRPALGIQSAKSDFKE